ncbi:unnamed protein product [Rotaria sp. Silwood2]|nr:unnamed protein product [Rotaria sp. Silwood2]
MYKLYHSGKNEDHEKKDSLPPYLDIQPGTIVGVWNTFAGDNNTLAIEGTTGAGTYFTDQTPANLIDHSLGTRYSSRGSPGFGNNSLAGLNTGFYATVAQCQPTLEGFRLGNSYPYSDREPLTVTVEGTNCDDLVNCVNWSLLYNGSTGLYIQMNNLAYGDYQSIFNTISYKSYRFLITSKRSISVFVSYGEIQLFGYSTQTSTSQNETSSNTSLVIQSGSVEALWNTFAGGMSYIATENSSGAGTYYIGQGPTNLFDNKTTSKYTSRGNSSSGSNAIAGLNTGFHVTIARCQPTLSQFRFATGDTGAERDPIMITVEGTNCLTLINCTSWTLLYNDTSGLENVLDRSTYGSYKSIPSPQSFASYRFLVTSKRNATNSIFVSYSEVELYGY